MVVRKAGYASRVIGTEVDSIGELFRYYTQELGAELPKSYAGRAKLKGRVVEEMVLQSWDFQDLVAAIRYMKQQKLRPDSFGLTFHYVGKAREAGLKPSKEKEKLGLLVQRAVAAEDDPTWILRLTSAKGKALEKVYKEWKKHSATKSIEFTP